MTVIRNRQTARLADAGDPVTPPDGWPNRPHDISREQRIELTREANARGFTLRDVNGKTVGPGRAGWYGQGSNFPQVSLAQTGLTCEISPALLIRLARGLSDHVNV